MDFVHIADSFAAKAAWVDARDASCHEFNYDGLSFAGKIR